MDFIIKNVTNRTILDGLRKFQFINSRAKRIQFLQKSGFQFGGTFSWDSELTSLSPTRLIDKINIFDTNAGTSTKNYDVHEVDHKMYCSIYTRLKISPLIPVVLHLK